MCCILLGVQKHVCTFVCMIQQHTHRMYDQQRCSRSRDFKKSRWTWRASSLGNLYRCVLFLPRTAIPTVDVWHTHTHTNPANRSTTGFLWAKMQQHSLSDENKNSELGMVLTWKQFCWKKTALYILHAIKELSARMELLSPPLSTYIRDIRGISAMPLLACHLPTFLND